VGEMPDESKHGGMGEIGRHARRTRGERDEDAGSQEIEQDSKVYGHSKHFLVCISA
jgi:hypothetical protein